MTTGSDLPPKQLSVPGNRGLLPVALWTAAVLTMILATILLADNQRNLRQLIEEIFGAAPQKAAEKTVPHSAPPIQQAVKGSPLLSMPPTDSTPLLRVERAEDRCARLEQNGQEKPVYSASTHFAQCTFMYVENAEDRPRSVFVQVQTDPSGMVSSFRLKLNTGGTQAHGITLEGLASLKKFGGFFHEVEGALPNLADRIEKWEDFQILLGPYLIEMDHELTDPTRFNLFGRLARSHQAAKEIWPMGSASSGQMQR